MIHYSAFMQSHELSTPVSTLQRPCQEEPPGIRPSLSTSTASASPVRLNAASSRLPGAGNRKPSRSRKSTFLGVRAGLEASLPLLVYSFAERTRARRWAQFPCPSRVAWPPCLSPAVLQHLVSAHALLYPRSPQRAPSRRPFGMTISCQLPGWSSAGHAPPPPSAPAPPSPLITSSGMPGSSVGLRDAARCWGNTLVLFWDVRRGFSERRDA